MRRRDQVVGPMIVGSVVLLLHSAVAAAPLVDCDNGKTITKALAKAKPGDVIKVQGTCHETLTITTDGITIDGQNRAVIDGGVTNDTVVVDGAQRVTIRGIDIQNGQFGVLGRGNASVALHQVHMHGHAKSGMRLEGSSSAELTDCTVSTNGLNGLEVDRGSEAKITGSFLSEQNAVFGVFVNNASSVTLTQAAATLQQNTLGMQIGANSSVFIAEAATTVTASHNLATGVTVVSGSTLFVFEGTIIAEQNRFNHGVSANSNANIDLDRGGTILARQNGQDGIQLEDSLLNLFNMPGLPGSRVETSGNGRHGLSAFLQSRIDLSGESEVISHTNGSDGAVIDNDSFLRLVNSTLTNNGGRDVALSFGSQADLNTTNTIGTLACDDTVLIRGTAGFTCPTP